MFATFITLILFLFPLAYSPGPGNMFFAANGARFGFAATVPANAGYHAATWIVTVAIGLGFGTAMEQFPQLFGAIKIAGAFYVLWIAWNLYKAGTFEGQHNATPAGFWEGVILMILNPKAYLIIILMFSQFLTNSEIGQFMGIVVISTVFTLNNLIAFSVWTLIGDKIAVAFRKPGHAAILNKVFGVILGLVAIWMVLS